MRRPRVGVLALQGDVPEHERALRSLVAPPGPRPVRVPADLEGLDALVLPGGESTTIADLLARSGLAGPLVGRTTHGMGLLATCAGLILISRRIEPSPGGRDPTPLGLIDVEVRRNDFGRQRESFEAPVRLPGVAGGPFPGIFIRAPRIISVGPGAEPIAWRDDGEVVGVRSGRLWGLTFHPELSDDRRLHRAFLAALGPAPADGTGRVSGTYRSGTARAGARRAPSGTRAA
ncbi:MAG: pyridoxal 5'-phosphate synthase glutaminase subunit PdxT [Thermoplasmata archaeon]